MTVFPKLSPLTVNTNTRLWKLGQISVCWAVGSFSRLFIGTVGLGKGVQLDGIDKLHAAVLQRPKGTPLITIANHASTVDDPFIWGLLKNRTFVSRIEDLRWTLGAQEICYQNLPLSWFFTCGKAIPIIRGKGVYQVAMDYAVDRLNQGNWVHIFPEGRVHQEDTMLPFKWGVGRLVMDSKVPPLIVPIYHQGFAKMHPLKGGSLGGWLPNPFASTLHVTVGDPIDTAAWRGQGEPLTSFLGANAASTPPPTDVMGSPRLHRQWITQQLQARMAELQTKVMGKRPKLVEPSDPGVGKAPWN